MSETSPPGNARMELVTDGGTTTLVLHGELDLAGVGAIGDQVRRGAAEAPGSVVVDLGNVRFMDSSGIALLLGLAGSSGRLDVRRPSQLVRDVITLTGLDDILVIEP